MLHSVVKNNLQCVCFVEVCSSALLKKIEIKCKKSNEQSLQLTQPVASQKSVDNVMSFWFRYEAIKTTKLLIL